MSESIQAFGTIFDFLKSEELGGTLLEVSDGDVLIRPDESATSIFVVETGEIRLFQNSAAGDPRLLDILGPGEMFGLGALGMLTVYGKLAISEGDSTVRPVQADRLREALRTRGDMAVQFLEILAIQLHDVWANGSKLEFPECRVRLLRKLLAFASSPAACRIPWGVDLRITHEQLAQAIGAARETVCKCLTSLRKENLVLTRRNHVIFDPARIGQACVSVQPAAELRLAV